MLRYYDFHNIYFRNKGKTPKYTEASKIMNRLYPGKTFLTIFDTDTNLKKNLEGLLKSSGITYKKRLTNKIEDIGKLYPILDTDEIVFIIKTKDLDLFRLITQSDDSGEIFIMFIG